MKHKNANAARWVLSGCSLGLIAVAIFFYCKWRFTQSDSMADVREVFVLMKATFGIVVMATLVILTGLVKLYRPSKTNTDR